MPPSRPRYKWVYFISPQFFSAWIFLAIYTDYNTYNPITGDRAPRLEHPFLRTQTVKEVGLLRVAGGSFLRECKVSTS